MNRPVTLIRYLQLASITLLLLPRSVQAQRTPLLEVDLETGRRRRIDERSHDDRADAELDALLDNAVGGQFSTAELDRVARALTAYLRSRRSRSAPRLLLFLYPGRISNARLRELREILVDIDLLIDPCPRSVCDDSLGNHVEALGKALGQPSIRAKGYTVRFNAITLQTAADGRAQASESYRLAAGRVIEASQTGRGRELVREAQLARAGYSEAMSRGIAQRLRAERLSLVQLPTVQREGATVSLQLAIHADRVRYQAQVSRAFVRAMEALGTSEETPRDVRLRVDALVPTNRGHTKRPFHCEGQPLRQYLAGRLTQAELWSTFIREEPRSGQTLAFDSGDAADKTDSEPPQDPDRVNDILAENSSLLAPCFKQEALRRRQFRGVTLRFTIDRSGQAIGLQLSERTVSSAFRRCVEDALRRIHFPPASQEHQVTYPVLISSRGP